MHTRRTTRRALALALLLALGALAMSACGGGKGQEEVKVRPLPQYEHDLRPGEYHSVKFEPSLSFRVGKGWSNAEEQLADYSNWGRERSGGYASRTSRRSMNPARRTR